MNSHFVSLGRGHDSAVTLTIRRTSEHVVKSPALYQPAGMVLVTRLDEAQKALHASMYALEFMCEDVHYKPELTTHDLSAVHRGCLHFPSITLLTVPQQTNQLWLCPTATRVHVRFIISQHGYLQYPTAQPDWHQTFEISVSSFSCCKGAYDMPCFQAMRLTRVKSIDLDFKN